MSLSSSFHMLSFQRKVQDALQSVERTLELERKPRLAADVDHTYGAKYRLVDLTSNAAIIAYMTCFEKIGLDAAVLKSIDKTKPATLRFSSSTSCRFLKEVKVDVPLERSYEVKEETIDGDPSNDTIIAKTLKLFRSSTKSIKAINHITEFHWEVEIYWHISVYSGTAVEDGKVIKSRRCKTDLITQSKGLESTTSPPIELSLTWLLQQIDTAELTSQFKVDTEDDKTKTPRRNEAVQKAVDFSADLQQWSQSIQKSFIRERLQSILQKHNPALPKPHTSTIRQLLGIKDQFSIFNPILPVLMEESAPSDGDYGSNEPDFKSIIGMQCSNDGNKEHNALLSSKDISKLLNEHIRTLEGAVCGIETSWPSDSSEHILSSSEATLSLLISHLVDLSNQYSGTMTYIESMMENQLLAAIGKRLTPNDLDKFVKYHNAKLLCPMPQPFSYSICQPKHYPVGLLSIESHDGENECGIHSHSREVNATSSLKIPLSTATVLELTGRQYLHGYMNHRFGTSHKGHQLIARARQFSSFILVIGNMTDGSTLDPKDAIIVQNKDEVIISLLLDELPTAKEFKDAVASLSPEQQHFARAYRKMQLASSVFGICVIQIKPQLEALLCLPKDSLDKEMKLTQDLMELFVEYQVPSDLMSYNGVSENVAVDDKISNVRSNVKSVLDVVNVEKEKQLKMEHAKTDMAMEDVFQRAAAASTMGMRMSQVMYCKAPAAQQAMLERSSYDRIPTANLAKKSRKFRKKSAIAPDSNIENFDDLMNEIQEETEMADEISSALDQPVDPLLIDADDLLDELHQLEAPNALAQPADASSGGENKSKITCTKSRPTPPASDQVVDFTRIPQILDAAVEKSGETNALRSTTIKTDCWRRNRQDNLVANSKEQLLSPEDVKKERNKAFDLLDALSRSGSLPIAYSDLHVVMAVTHCFDKDVMSTVVCDNINPIEKLECSTLLLASAVHGVPARELIADINELQRLEGALPLLLQSQENNEVANENEAQEE